MNHRYDDQYSRREREWDRDRDREGRDNEWRRDESSRASFHPGGYGFDDTHQSGRSQSEYSSPYGQREPYAAGGRDEWRQDDSRRSEWGGEGRGGFRQSRYSESQFGQPRHDESRRYAQGEYDARRGWAGRSTSYGGPQNWDEGNRGQSYGDRGRGDESRYGNRGSGYGRGSDYYGGSRYTSGRYGDEDSAPARRYGVGYSGSPDYDRDRPLGDTRFNRGDQPRYYGTGYYGEGTSAFGGGFGEERSRGQPSSTGWMRDSEHSSRFYGGGYEQQHEERPGLLRRLFGKGPKGYQRSDERLREDISERLMQAHNIDSSEVTVTVQSGKVTLEGTVPDRYMKHAIEDLVDACPGVQDIDNRVRVDRNAGGTGTSGYTAVSSASSTTPGSTASTGTSYGGGSGAGMSPTTGSGGSQATTSGASTSGTNRSTRKDS